MKFLDLIIIASILLTAACSNNSQQLKNAVDVDEEEELSVVAPDTERKIAETDEYEDNYYDSENTDLSDRPPKIKSIRVESISNNFKEGFKAVILTDEPEEKDIDFIYQWKLNGTDIIGATEQTLEWQEGFKKGDVITLEVIPYDDLTEGIWKSEGNFTIPNSPPLIESIPSGTVSSGSFNYKVEATDLDEDTLTYSLENAPEGMAIDQDTGEITWKYGIANKGDYKINIIVSDNDGGQTFQELSVTVN